MDSRAPLAVAIIGAGPAGMVLAISLLRRGIQCDIYESRPSRSDAGVAYAALSLQVNGLRVLDRLGIYKRLLPFGYSAETMYVHDLISGTVAREGEGLETAYGFKTDAYLSFRISCGARDRVGRAWWPCSIRVSIRAHCFGEGFHIVSEKDSGVTFVFADGVERRADVLVGADGIHSRVRAYITTQEPTYSSLVGLGAEVPRSRLRLGGSTYDADRFPVSMKRGRSVVNLVLQGADASRVFVGTGKMMSNQSDEEWAALEADKELIRRFFMDDVGAWPDVVQSALENIDPNKAYLWPVFTMPRLSSWTSPGCCNNKKVAIIGDAAHALSPITGQGVDQAFEDAYMLATILTLIHPQRPSPRRRRLPGHVSFWNDSRMERVNEVVDRLVGGGGQKEGAVVVETKSRVAAAAVDDGGGGGRPDAWLYGVDIDGQVESWGENTAM